MTRIRRKGVSIVESNEGVLVVAGRGKIYSLPGGGANKGESREKAAIRELKEETGLRAKHTKFLFEYEGRKWRDYNGRIIRNHAKVFLVKSYGRLRPRHEIKYVAWWKPWSKIRVSRNTIGLINKYYNLKKLV